MDTPLTLVDLETQLCALPALKQQTRFAVAVSGGSDSLCLLWLLKQWADVYHKQMVALVVNHNLRPESTQEANWTLGLAKKWGVEGQILPLTWERSPPQGGIQTKAREHRYERLLATCWSLNIQTLFLGHHQDDQFETFGMRNAKGSSPYGLACMPKAHQRFGITLCRPLLAFPKVRLQATLKANNLPWVEDPSNDSLVFERVRQRHHLATLSLDRKNQWLKKIDTFGQHRVALEKRADDLCQQAIQVFPQGQACVDLMIFNEASPPVQQIILKRLLRSFGGQKSFFKQPQLETWRQFILSPAFHRPRTLGGCCLVPRKGKLWIYREAGLIVPQRVFQKNAHGFFGIWDRRFYVAHTPIETTLPPPYPMQPTDEAGLFPRRSLGTWPHIQHHPSGGFYTITPRFQSPLQGDETFVDRGVFKVLFLGGLGLFSGVVP